MKSEPGKEYNCSSYVSFTSKTEAEITITTEEVDASFIALYEINRAGKWY